MTLVVAEVDVVVGEVVDEVVFELPEGCDSKKYPPAPTITIATTTPITTVGEIPRLPMNTASCRPLTLLSVFFFV